MATYYQARAGLCIKGKLNAEALKIKNIFITTLHPIS